MKPAMLSQVLERIDENAQESIGFLFELLRFPGIGIDPGQRGACLDTARWLMEYLSGFGLAPVLHETTGQPAIVARWGLEKAHLPHVLFYGHYDVQPVDPLELWHFPPFEPRIAKNARGHDAIYARGAADDKGQLMTFLEASRAWASVHGSLPFRLTVLLEGDEEGDSGHIERFLKKQGKALKADIAMICDTGMWDEKAPAITTSLRGCIAEDITITGPRIDLHSGYYGGAAVNPIKVLSALLAKLHDKNGHIVIPGFYDGVKPVSKKRLAGWKRLGLRPEHFLGEVGLSVPAGEKGCSLAEQLWARPTCEINGIWGGYQGAGMKTVLPSKAHAKLTFRLVAGQNAKKIRANLRKKLKAILPEGCRIEFTSHGGNSVGIEVPEDDPWIALAAEALKDEWGREAAIVGSGVSIPVVTNFREFQGMESLLVGFCRFDDAAHSPNEKYDVECFHKGTRSWARVFAKIAEGKPR